MLSVRSRRFVLVASRRIPSAAHQHRPSLRFFSATSAPLMPVLAKYGQNGAQLGGSRSLSKSHGTATDASATNISKETSSKSGPVQNQPGSGNPASSDHGGPVGPTSVNMRNDIQMDLQHVKTDIKKNLLDSNGHSHSHSEAPTTSSPSSDHSHTHSEPSGHSHSTSSDHAHSHSLFSGHSHSHQPNELLSTSLSLLKNPAVRITWIGLLVNIGMAAFKGLGGVYFHSQSLLADAIHSVSDTIADILTLATVNVAARVGSPTRFPLGYGKIETVGSLLVSSVLLFAGVSVGWSLVLLIFEYTLPGWLYEYAASVHIGHSHSHSVAPAPVSDHSHSHAHGTDLLGAVDTVSEASQLPAMNAAWLAGASIVVKEVLFRKTMNVAELTNLKVLVANAWHHRVDSLTLMVALLTITGAHIFSWAWLDSVGGLLVSVLIIRTGWGSFASSWYDLVDRGEPASSELYLKVKTIVDNEVLAITDGAFEVLKLSVMPLGANSNVFVTLKELAGEHLYRLDQLNGLETRVKNAIRADDKFIRNIFVQFQSHKKDE